MRVQLLFNSPPRFIEALELMTALERYDNSGVAPSVSSDVGLPLNKSFIVILTLFYNPRRLLANTVVF